MEDRLFSSVELKRQSQVEVMQGKPLVRFFALIEGRIKEYRFNNEGQLTLLDFYKDRWELAPASDTELIVNGIANLFIGEW